MKITEDCINFHVVLAVRDIVQDPDWIASELNGMDLVRIVALGEIQGVFRLADQLKEELNKTIESEDKS